MSHKPIRRRSAGFSLIEIVAVIVIMGVLMALAAPLLAPGLAAYETTADSVSIQGKGRYAIERIARELREVRRNPVTPANFDFLVMGASQVQFVKLDGETVTISGNALPDLTLAYASVGQSRLADDVTAVEFKYYQTDGVTETALPAEAVFVHVRLTLGSGSVTHEERTRVALRNIQ